MEEKLCNSVHPDDRTLIADHLRSAVEKVDNFTFEVRWGTVESFRWAMGELVPEMIDDEVCSLYSRVNVRFLDSLEY